VSIAAQTITTLEELEDVRADWRALWLGARAATIFQSPDWLIPWWRHFAPGQLVCVAVRCGEDLAGLAPLYRERGSQRLLPLGISLSDYLDVLVAQESSELVCRALEAEIARAAGFNEICFPGAAPDASVLSLALDGHAATTSPGQTSPELALGPPHTVLKNVPANQRQNLRTAENRARRRGCIVGDATEVLPQFVSALMQLHCARQQHLGREGLGSDRRVLPFFNEAFGALAREGVVRAYSMLHEGRLIGGYLGFLHRGRAAYYFGGFDQAFAFESPGTILIGHAMRRAAAEGAHSFDFLRGAEPYKYAWGARDRQLLSLSFVRQLSDVALAS
jgi:CelD/BcsL family acetyltransferase involved in cellulose biosynthesis